MVTALAASGSGEIPRLVSSNAVNSWRAFSAYNTAHKLPGPLAQLLHFAPLALVIRIILLTWAVGPGFCNSRLWRLTFSRRRSQSIFMSLHAAHRSRSTN